MNIYNIILWKAQLYRMSSKSDIIQWSKSCHSPSGVVLGIVKRANRGSIVVQVIDRKITPVKRVMLWGNAMAEGGGWGCREGWTPLAPLKVKERERKNHGAREEKKGKKSPFSVQQ